MAVLRNCHLPGNDFIGDVAACAAILVTAAAMATEITLAPLLGEVE